MLDVLRRVVAAGAQDPAYKLLALLIAFTAWFWVQSQETDTARIRVNVAYDWPDDLTNVEPVLHSATVIAQGPRVAIRRAQRERPTIRIDLDEAGPGVHDVRLDTYDIQELPSGLSLVAFSPDAVTVRLDHRLRKSVPVVPKWVGRAAQNHYVASVRVVPDVVEVSGPRALIQSIEAVETMNLDVSGWEQDQQVPVDLDLPRGVQSTRPWQGEAVVDIESLVGDRNFASVPVVVRHPDWVAAEGSATIPLALRGPTAALKAIKPDQVLAVVELPPNPEGERYRVGYEASRPPRYVVMGPGPDVEVSTTPPEIEVVRR